MGNSCAAVPLVAHGDVVACGTAVIAYVMRACPDEPYTRGRSALCNYV
jgi:hypothetical protein